MPFLPSQAAESCLKRARSFLDLADRKLPISFFRGDLRRMALVMAVAAIDSYMHGIVLLRIADVRQHVHLPKALGRMEMPFSDLACLADASVKAQRHAHRARPWVQVKAALQNRLHTVTFQSYEDVAKAFSMAGVEQPWKKVASELGQQQPDIKRRLSALVQRRNQIVHEGDLKRSQRPRRRRFNAVNQRKVKADIDWVVSLITAMEKVVASEP